MNWNSGPNNSYSVYQTNGVNGSSRALQEANDRKARKLTFYKNGEPFSNPITVSILPGKDFRTMEQLCTYLTEKTKIANGVQYIFTTNGERILTLNELEHSQSYVVSGIKNFQRFPYGQMNKLKNLGLYSQPLNNNITRSVREDDLKLLRPLSSKFNTVYHNINQPINTSYKEGRIITIVNNRDHKLRSRVLLNLKSPKSFDIIVKDLGQAVRIKNAKRMFTASGHEVRSFSQLKRDMIGIELFYLESSNSKSPPHQTHMKSHSLESINQTNSSKESDSSKHFISDINQFKTLIESNFSDINPSRRGESSLSERISLNMDSTIEYSSPLKTCETQTSPDFVKESRKNAKKILKIEKEFNHQNEQNSDNYETKVNPNFLSNHLIPKPQNPSIHSPNRSPSHVSNQSLHESPKMVQKSKTNSQTNSEIKKTPKAMKLKENTDNKNKWDKNELRRDALQEYAETLLRETAFMVQNESLKRDSMESDREVKKNTIKSSPKLSPKIVESKSVSNLESKQLTTNQSYVNEVTDKKNKNKTETESDEEEEEKVPNIINKENKMSNPSIDSNPSVRLKSNSPIKSFESSPNKQIVGTKDTKDPVDNLRDGTDIPDKFLRLKWVHGFNGNGSKNLFILSSGELAFFVGTVAVLWNPDQNIQRLYNYHTNDINGMAVRKTRNIIATSEGAHKSHPFGLVRVWSSKSLKTYAVLTQNVFGTIITALDFSIQGSLMVINSEQSINLTIWNWKDSEIVASSRRDLKSGEVVKGAAFHPTEDDILVTFGNKHLTVWQQRRDGTVDCRTAIKPESKAAKLINCVDFLPDHSLLSGDTTGTLTIWAPLEDENGFLEFVVKEVKGHDSSLTCLQLLQNNILISGDFDGTVKTWDVNDEQFRLLNAIKLPPTSGSICSITMVHYTDRESDNIDIYIGTSMNLILRGSALQATNYTVIFEGHSMAVRGLAVDPKYEFFYSSALDQKICKWNESNLIWRTTIENQCVSAAVHPSGEILAVGSVSGTIFIVNASNGTIISQLPVSKVCIGCLAYSPDGDLLGAGCQDGILYILPALDNGYAYEKVSVLKGPFAILSLQWSIDSQFVLTSVNENNYQEMILWDLPNCRYMKGISNFSDSIIWFDPTCSGGEDVRGIWDNQYLQEVVNLSCHCSPSRKYLVSGDEDGFLRLFTYPSTDTKAGFFEYAQGGGSVTEVRFIYNEKMLISGNFTGSLFVWDLIPYDNINRALV